MAGFNLDKLAICLVCFTAHYLVIGLIEGHGLGTEYIWAQDTDIKHLNTDDAIFFERDSPEFSSVNNDFEKLLKRLRVEVVAPGKYLLKVMNTISTKTRAMFFLDYERYFEKLNVGSTSRPMLLSYLGLQFASQEQLISWYAPFKERAQAQIADSCRSLLISRRHSLKLSKEDLQVVDRYKTKVDSNFQLAYLVFQNNLNLFMLDNFLLLCIKIEPEKIDFNGASLMIE